MPFSWKETRICPRYRKTITRICKEIGHDYQQYSVARKSEEDLFTIFVDPDALDNVIPLYQERFLSVIECDITPSFK